MPSTTPKKSAAEPRLAEQIALAIERDVIRKGWKVGEKLGSEADLAAHHGVSRWTLREAISIVERDGLVEFRRGHTGGVIIAAPALDVVGSAIRSYLGYSRVTTTALHEARELLEGLVTRLAAERMTDGAIARLRAVTQEAADARAERSLEMAYSLLRELLDAARSPALKVFAYALSQVTADLALQRGVPESTLRKAALELVQTRSRQIEAVIGGDVVGARRIGAEHLTLANQLVANAKRGRSPTALLDMPRLLNGVPMKEGPLKRSDIVSRSLQADLVSKGWPVGQHLGTEADLMQRFDVSRSVLREALRPLERIGVVVMQRGRYPGVKVSTPEPSAIVRSAALYLKHSKLELRDTFEVTSELEMSAMSALAHLPDDAHREAVAALRNVVSKPRRPTVAAADQCIREPYFALASLSHNPIVALFLRILAETMELKSGRKASETQLARDIARVQAGQAAMIDAVERRDAALARRRMMELRRVVMETFDVGERSAEDLLSGG
ncbi:MAG TPA: GntR family transcriptional regulator [Nevskiaceae bacterium]|nr:GntR family transcriptional regulator [Nevskiaceae bacterium]